MIFEVAQILLLAQQCAPDVHPQTIISIIETESSRDSLAFNVNDKGIVYVKPTNISEAQALAEDFYSKGINFDVGLMQINSANFKALGVEPYEVLDVCTNIRLGGEILIENYTSASKSLNEQDALSASLSAYNTGSFKKGLENGYVDKVKKQAEQYQEYIVPSISSKKIEKAQEWNVFLQDEETFW